MKTSLYFQVHMNFYLHFDTQCPVLVKTGTKDLPPVVLSNGEFTYKFA
jgi:hypothetical protein